MRLHLRCGARAVAASAPKPPADVAFADALVVVPGTWVVFDHFTHRVTLHRLCARRRRTRDVARSPRRIRRTAARSRGRRFRVDVRAKGPVDASLDRARRSSSASRVRKHTIYEGDVYQLQLGIRYSCETRRLGIRLLPAIARAQPVAVHVLLRARRSRGLRRLAGIFGSARRRGTRACGRSPGRGRAATSRRAMPRSRPSCSPNQKERAEHVMLVDLGPKRSGRRLSGRQRSRRRVDGDRALQPRHAHRLERRRRAARRSRRARPLRGGVSGRHRDRNAQDPRDAADRRARTGARAAFTPGASRTSISTATWIRASSCAASRSRTGRAYWQASAGIVADSDPAAEYDEVLAKTRIVRDVLGIAS